MSISVTLQRSQDILELPTAKPLDEAVWQAWVLKERVRSGATQRA